MKQCNNATMDPIEELLTRGVDTVYPTKEALEKVLRSGKKLRLYQGFDPTGTQLHIGHMVGLRKLRQFQDLGHHVIFLIGDGTGLAGDPSGKLVARDRFLTRKELRKNATDYVKQAAYVVRFEGENAAEILFNGDWLTPITLSEFLELLGHFTLQQLMERDIFDRRVKEGKEVNMREFVYPLLQGYDSVAMKVDLEIGGTDQTFNMLTGRKLVREILDKEKYVLTMPLLTDAQGRKIGKTEGNVIALTAPPNELFGMIMSLPDDIIVKSFEFITDVSMDEVKKIEKAMKNGENPMDHKKKLAHTLTRMLNGESEAKKAQEYFENTNQNRVIPQDNPIIRLSSPTLTSLATVVEAKFAKSNTEAKNLIRSGAIRYNGEQITDEKQMLHHQDGNVLSKGRHTFGTVTVSDLINSDS